MSKEKSSVVEFHWNRDIDEKEIISRLKKETILYFDGYKVFSSQDIAKILVIVKQAKDKGCNLKLVVKSKKLYDVLLELHFDEIELLQIIYGEENEGEDVGEKYFN